MEGLEDTGNWMLDEGVDKAKDGIMSEPNRRVWKGEVKNSFVKNEWEFNRSYFWKGSITNTAPHAESVENGLPPGTNPTIQTLIPWVDDQLEPNSETKDLARQSHIENWQAPLRALAKEYGTAEVLTTFAVKGKLEDEGYQGIHFMREAESYLEQMGKTIVKGKIEKHMQNELRKRGV